MEHAWDKENVKPMPDEDKLWLSTTCDLQLTDQDCSNGRIVGMFSEKSSRNFENSHVLFVFVLSSVN